MIFKDLYHLEVSLILSLVPALQGINGYVVRFCSDLVPVHQEPTILQLLIKAQT
jgi:RNase P/RNase MRP subunit p29